MSTRFLDLKMLFHRSLKELYDENEIIAILYAYLHDKWNISKEELYINDRITEKITQEIIEKDLYRLASGEPLQYVCGKTSFYGLPILVDQSVLIPRPETEELVDLIIRKNREKRAITILDIGTGSGAIAIALAKNLPNAKVMALDFSEEALQIAQQNALSNQVSIDFFRFDILHDAFPADFEKMDIIVSNPPYIPKKEKEFLHPNVALFEPPSALFVPNDDPLLFYRKIAERKDCLLKKSGKVYFETHENYHDELQELFLSCGFSDVVSICDINGRSRMMVCGEGV